MNIANILTVLRILITFLFVGLLYKDGVPAKIAALGAFTAATVTDFLDGYLARKYHLITAFGKILDPIADKLLVLSAFFIFMQMNIIEAWMFYLISAREVLVTVLRLRAVGHGTALAAEAAGKLKTVLQISVVYLIMIYIIVETSGGQGIILPGLTAIYILMCLTVWITLYSGFTFLRNNRKNLFHVG